MSTPGEGHAGAAVSVAPDQGLDEETLEEYADIFAHMRTNDEARARAGDVRGLWTTADNTISHLSSHFVTEPHVDFSSGWTFQLQNLWHLYYVTGKFCSEDAVAPVVLQLIETSHRGLLARNQISSNVSVAGSTVFGTGYDKLLAPRLRADELKPACKDQLLLGVAGSS
ncbi:hypothetical protein NPX13_g3171 [Xylaria arbuscula]|uniref:Uncharacterized protein n=1 Tax=Xylaria arbuscula TaxID=114810 RepID=A0A9W8NHT2_9PEZI|nr:hypothetical protein NPX13_g3171 [Xylaria arbuscula]